MNLPDKIELPKLTDFLPMDAVQALEYELGEFERKAPGRLSDMASLRYVYASVLNHYGLTCPHPYRVHHDLNMFECRLCQAYIVRTAP